MIYLRWMLLRNRIASWIRRLQRPKYLIGALAGGAWLYLAIFRHGRSPMFFFAGGRFPAGPSPSLPDFSSPGFVAASAFAVFLLALGRQALAWVSPPRHPGLRFSEAEIAFLFPAPIPRRRLIHFSLIGTQLTTLIWSLPFALIFLGGTSRFGLGGGTLSHALGWWIILVALSLHSTGAGLAAARRQARGGNGARTFALIAIGLIGGVAIFSFCHQARPPGPAESEVGPFFRQYLAALFDTGFLHWFLQPFKGVVAPLLAPDLRAFFITLGPAVIVLAALYAWVVRMEVSFEEGSIDQAEKRARVRIARSAGGGGLGSAMPRARREPFRLADRGRPETAFLWKNLLAIQSWFNLRIFVTLIAVVAAMAAGNLHLPRDASHPRAFAPLVLILAGMAAFYILAIGPQLLRQDLRNDLGNADLLKTYPLEGWQVLLGEILAPTAILSGLLWLALLAAAWALGNGNWGLGSGDRAILGGCAALIVPPLCALQLLVPNAMALLFPGWFQSTRARKGGIDVMGQRLIFALGQLFIVMLALLPAALAAVLVMAATQWLMGLALAAALATVAVLVILGGEVWCGLWWLGTRFEKLDVATELKP